MKGILVVVYAVYALAVTCLFLDSCTHKSMGPAVCNPRYTTDIRPIVGKKCAIAGCHVAGAHQGNFTSYDTLKAQADNGRIRQFVFDLKIMPPANVDSLTASEKEKIKCWLDNGALPN